MSYTILRTMTMKSKIGFGRHPDLTVYELIQLRHYRELIWMYYKLDKINFDEEIKEYLGIKGCLVIKKPSKNPEIYDKNIYQMVCAINDRNKEFTDQNENRFATLYEAKGNKKRAIVQAAIQQRKINSKISNRERNHGKTKRKSS